MDHIVHFLWFGGPINATSVDTIGKWAEFLEKAQVKSREKFKIAVWIDSEGSTDADIHETKARLSKISHVEIEFRDIAELQAGNQEMHRIIRYEIDKLNSNYSAASDVGRYTILAQEGGMYLDTDVHPPKEVDTFIEAWKKEGVLVTECASRYSNISNSDLLIATDVHLPIVQQLVEAISINYKSHEINPSDDTSMFEVRADYRYHQVAKLIYQTYSARDQETIYTQAMMRAGPDMLKIHILAEDDTGLTVMPGTIPLPTGSLRESLELTGTAGSWIGRPTNAHVDIDKVLSKLSKCIDFELESVGILRTDDHIQSAIEALGYYEPEYIERINLLIERVIALIQEKLNTEAQAALLQCCQLTFKFAQTLELYENNHLLTKTGLTPFTPEMSLPDACSRLHQPFATQHLILPHEQKERSENCDIGYAHKDLETARSDFRSKLLLFYRTQYHDNMVDGLLKFTSDELIHYIEILRHIDMGHLPLEIKNMHAQLLIEAQDVQLRDQRMSRIENIKLRMKELKLSMVSENSLNNRLDEKITSLEGLVNKTKQQTDKLSLLQKVKTAQEADWMPMKKMFESNKLYIMRRIGVETFALSNAILDRKINALAQNNGDDLRSRLR